LWIRKVILCWERSMEQYAYLFENTYLGKEIT